ncbi:uncharacterized protein LOC117344917 [Pecten maximus]|uniref:uncharacterized protein LOC117344917 n=1 Tax=Pecten maximus TaxID=6579 RepID=UPI0014584588|nr:uncharacterized protein LOC117344917 [Pecten maximus]
MTTTWCSYLSLLLVIRPYQTSSAPSHLVLHMLDDLRPVECISVQCSAGKQLSFCKRNSTSDYCHQCPIGSSQPLHVDSRRVKDQKDIPKCVRTNIACPPETTPIKVNGKKVDCKCDTSRGYVGENYMFCLKYTKCPPGTGFEVQSGSCSPCPLGSFNQGWNYESCKTHTNCTQINRETRSYGNTTKDSVCGEMLEPDVITSPVTPTSAVLGDTVEYQGRPKQGYTIHEDADKDMSLKHPQDCLLIETERHKNGILTVVTLVMGVAVLVLAILLTLVTCKLRKDKPMSMRLCERMATSGNDKPGIQAEDDCGPEMTLVCSDNRDDGVEQPGTMTIYPKINAVPCKPTAPSMTPSMDL